MEFKRTKAQNAVIKNRGGGLLVSAAAGSGKTSVLVERLLDRIETEHCRIDEFLIITFTKAAAEELRTRIARTLNKKIRIDPSNRHLMRQTILLYNTQISTIHSFCTVLLREWGHLIDIPVDFSLFEEEDAKVLMSQVLNDVLEQRYEAITPDSNFAKLLDILSAGRDDHRLVEIVLDVYRRMQSHPDPIQWMDEQREILALHGVKEAGETIWGQLLLADTKRVVFYWLEEISYAITLTKEEESLNAYIDSLTVTYEALQRLSLATEEGWDAVAASSQIAFPRLKPIRNCQDQRLQDQIKLIRSQCKDAMDGLNARFANSSQELLEDMNLLYPAMMGLFDLVEAFSNSYSKAKMRKGMLDFSDLEHKAVSLLIGEDGLPTDIAKQIGSRFIEIMVDEYQDTNQVQNTIFTALSNQGRNLFLVGDVKQSIYRFRLADPTIFLDKYNRFVSYEKAQAGQERKILLSQNFRSRPEVLEAVNYLFRNIMSEQLGEMNYTEEESLYTGGDFPSGEGYETELHVLDFTELNIENAGKKLGNNELEARFVVTEISKLLRKPFLISSGDGEKRAVSPEDIAILLRSPGTVRHFYAQELDKQQIPWSAEGNSNFFETTEISVILSFLQIIDNPRQDVPLLSVLHSPLYGFDGERLAQVRHAGSGDIYYALQAASNNGMEDCQAFLSELEELRFSASETSCHELIWKLYQKTNAIEIFCRMPNGKQREKNLLDFYELACRYENSGHRGLFGFLFHVSKLQDGGAIFSNGGVGETSGVKILSIHRSKGLEYPVVFLCGLGKRFNSSDIQNPVLFHSKLGLGPRGVDTEQMVEFQTLPRQAVALQLKQEMLAEEMRLLYVAMTRAKDKLIMTHALSYGESELKKLASYVTCPIHPNVLSNCSSAGQWVILAAMARPEGEVLQNIADLKNYSVQEAFGLPWHIYYQRGIPQERKALLQQKQEETRNEVLFSQEKLWDLLSWSYPYEKLAAIPAKITATQLTRELAFEGAAVKHDFERESFSVNRTAFHRPRFASESKGLTSAQKGTAVHTVMQNIRLDHTETVEAIQEEIHRMIVEDFITKQEAEAMNPQKIYVFFSSIWGKKMKESTTLHREFPFSMLIPAKLYYTQLPKEEQLLLQGVMDCWFETAEGITLIDFKTNRISEQDAEETAEIYRRQMEAYSYALEVMTGNTVKHKVLWFIAANCGVEFHNDGSVKKTCQ